MKVLAITESQLKDYLKKKIGSDCCPLCHHDSLELQPETRLLGQKFEEELEFIFQNRSDESLEELRKCDSIFDHVLIVKCRNCGQLQFFDFNHVAESQLTDEY